MHPSLSHKPISIASIAVTAIEGSKPSFVYNGVKVFSKTHFISGTRAMIPTIARQRGPIISIPFLNSAPYPNLSFKKTVSMIPIIANITMMATTIIEKYFIFFLLFIFKLYIL